MHVVRQLDRVAGRGVQIAGRPFVEQNFAGLRRPWAGRTRRPAVPQRPPLSTESSRPAARRPRSCWPDRPERRCIPVRARRPWLWRRLRAPVPAEMRRSRARCSRVARRCAAAGRGRRVAGAPTARLFSTSTFPVHGWPPFVQSPTSSALTRASRCRACCNVASGTYAFRGWACWRSRLNTPTGRQRGSRGGLSGEA